LSSMAARTGAGTGVIVSLVVFVLTTVFLLVLTIVFYAKENEARQAESAAYKELEKYAKDAERNTDQFQRLISSATTDGGRSVTGYLLRRQSEIASYAGGAAATDLAAVKTLVASMNLERAPGDGGLAGLVKDMQSQLNSLRREQQANADKIAERDAMIAQLEQERNRERQSHVVELQGAIDKIDEYRAESQRYAQDVQATKAHYTSAIEAVEDDFRRFTESKEAEIDELTARNVVLVGKINDFERKLDEIRIKAADPATLVDGHIIEVGGNDTEVFIDRGRQHRIVLGMTFEAFDAQGVGGIRMDPRSGAMPRGKASLQVIKVGETTSTCKVTRSVASRPIVRDDIIVNAVYDPELRFKFLVHGKFDVDGDGLATDGGAEAIRAQVVDWGGTVVHASDLPGDLDFLVLGERPVLPPPLPVEGVSSAQLDSYLAKRAAYDQYEKLLSQAIEAQIPVLNANRFFILIGHIDR
ncbi:MAG: hypothetical protein KDA25_06585, partial [Phycisphaerales bacterium]|nr:hypothetical protein [Phycisphaerales bacterium]